MKIVLKKKFAGKEKGDIINIDRAVGARIIKQGFASAHEDEKERNEQIKIKLENHLAALERLRSSKVETKSKKSK